MAPGNDITLVGISNMVMECTAGARTTGGDWYFGRGGRSGLADAARHGDDQRVAPRARAACWWSTTPGRCAARAPDHRASLAEAIRPPPAGRGSASPRPPVRLRQALEDIFLPEPGHDRVAKASAMVVGGTLDAGPGSAPPGLPDEISRTCSEVAIGRSCRDGTEACSTSWQCPRGDRGA